MITAKMHEKNDRNLFQSNWKILLSWVRKFYGDGK